MEKREREREREWGGGRADALFCLSFWCLVAVIVWLALLYGAEGWFLMYDCSISYHTHLLFWTCPLQMDGFIGKLQYMR